MDFSQINTVRYKFWIATAIVLVSVFSGYFAASSAVSEDERDAIVINISGRQRMLSQKVTKLALMITMADTDSQFNALQNELIEARALWVMSHEALKAGSEEIGIPKNHNSEQIQKLYEQNEAYFIPMNKGIDGLLQISFEHKDNAAEYLELLIANEKGFLRTMNQITLGYADAAIIKNDQLQKILLIIVVVIVVVLLSLVVFLFEPIAKSLEKQFSTILEKNEELLTTERFLAKSNEVAKVAGWRYDMATKRMRYSKSTKNLFEMDSTSGYESALSFLNEKVQALIDERTDTANSIQNGFDIETEVRDLENNKMWVRIVAAPVFKDGELDSIDGIIQDITEIVTDRQELEKSRTEAMSANQAKSEFLAVMSHEIRTPLNAVLGFTELLSKEISDETHLEYLDTVNRSGKTLLMLINDILDLSKIEAGKMKIHKSPVNIQFLVDEIQDMFSLKFEQKNVKFLCQVDESVPETIVTDVEKLKQILINLLGNAHKFTINGYVNLKVTSSVSSQENGELRTTVRFDIVDTGIGIPNSDLERIFNSFEQQDSAVTRKFGGTGLGLAISNKLAMFIHGNLTVDSTVGHGSVFSLVIDPAEVAEQGLIAPAKELTTNAIPSFNEEYILVVDDNKLNRDLVRSWLLKANFKVIEAENGKEALESISKTKPALVFMDIRMPVMDGYEATAFIKNNDTTMDIPVIALTASATVEEEAKVFSSQFNDFLTKPVSSIQLFTTITRFIQPQEKIAQIDPQQTDEKPETIDKNVAGVTAKTRNNISEEVKSILKTDLMEKWKSIKDLMIMDDIESFSSDLAAFSKEQEVELLADWSERMLHYVSTFDVAAMEREFNQYPQIVEKLI